MTGSSNGDGVNANFWVGHSQREPLPFNTTYIPTVGSSVTRNEDGNQWGVPSPLLGSGNFSYTLLGELTAYSDMVQVISGANRSILTIGDAASGGLIHMYYPLSANGRLTWQCRHNAVTDFLTADVGNVTVAGDIVKWAIRYDASDNSLRLFIDGVVQVDTGVQTIGLQLGVNSEFHIGEYDAGSLDSCVRSRNVKIYNSALTDAQIGDLQA